MQYASSLFPRNNVRFGSRSWRSLIVLLCTLVFVVVACSDNTPKTVEKKKVDDIGREWKPKATFNPSTNMLTVDAKLADGQEADRLVITELDAEGNEIVSTDTNGSHLGVELDPDTKNVTCEMSKGGHGVVTSSKVP